VRVHTEGLKDNQHHRGHRISSSESNVNAMKRTRV